MGDTSRPSTWCGRSRPASLLAVYSTCLFCQQPLGRNDGVESFPVGRRLAYDAARGRLWVVCRKCERWNLTPLDARWEAIEACERLFRATRLRASTDQVGLARLKEGLELVRIGRPLRPEMAAWRYGDQFGRRFKRHVAVSATVAAGAAGIILVGPVMGLVSLGAVSPVFNMLNLANVGRQMRKVVARIPIDGHDEPLVLRSKHLRALRLVSDRRGGFSLHVEGVRRMTGGGWGSSERDGAHDVHGDEAVRIAGQMLPLLNHKGGSRRVVTDAVGLLETARDPSELFATVAEADRRRLADGFWQAGDAGQMHAIPIAARLALEMASHEEGERRALEGELAMLESAWQRAEEIAAIADDLLLPSGVHGALARLKGERDG